MHLLHTADWQLGMTRYFLNGEAQPRYSAARRDVVAGLGALATASTVHGMILDVDPKWRAKILKLDESHHPLIVRLGQAAEWLIKHASVLWATA